MSKHPPVNRKPALGFIFITLLLDVLGFGLLIPISPRLVEQLLHADESEAAPYVGLLASTFAAMQFLFVPVLGALSDRFGRRPVILISLLGSGIDYFAMALSPNLAWLFVTRALNGISGSNISACNAYVADVTPPERRAAGFGMLGAAFGLGFVLGPLIGGILGDNNIRLPFYVAGGLTILNWAYGYFVLPESLPPERRRMVTLAKANPFSVFIKLRKHALAAALVASLSFFHMAQFVLHAVWVLYTEYRYDWGPVAVAVSLAVVGVTAGAVQGGLSGRLIKRLGERRSLVFGMLLAIGAYAAYGLATHGWMIYVIIALASIGSISGPAAQTMLTKSVNADEQGELQGAVTGVQSIAGVVGYTTGGLLFGYATSDRVAIKVPGAPFFLCAALTGLALLGVFWALRHYKPDPRAQG